MNINYLPPSLSVDKAFYTVRTNTLCKAAVVTQALSIFKPQPSIILANKIERLKNKPHNKRGLISFVMTS